MSGGRPGTKSSQSSSGSGGGSGGGAAAEASSGRGASRVRDIQAALDEAAAESRRSGAPLEYLDVGCSEGRITAAVAGHLGLRPGSAFGVDVVDQPADPAFTFRRTDGVTLAFPDATFGLETMMMSAHHFREPAKVFAEARRVARPGATLVMREHDTAPAYLALFFDLAHAVYAVMVNAEETPQQFAEAYAAGQYAFYRSRDQWAELIAPTGWKLVRYIQPSLGPKKTTDFMQAYYAVFRAA